MLEGESASVEVKFEPAERFPAASARGKSQLLGARTPILIGGVIFALTVTFAPTFLYNQFALPFGIASIGASFVGLLFFLVTWNMFAMARKSPEAPARNAYMQDFTLTAAPDGLRLVTDTLNAHYAWAGILRLHDTDTHLYIHTDGAHVITVPKRCFATRDENSRFSIIVRAHIGDKA
jgi:hypothetical protein